MRTSASVWSGSRRRFLTPLAFVIVLAAVVPSALGQASGGREATASVTIPEGATPESLFTDFLHYARLGRFRVADAYANALLEHKDLDPVSLLEVSLRDPQAVKTLQIIIQNSSISDSAVRVLELIERGEHEKRKDREQIRINIKKLAGDPQQVYVVTRRLVESGQYAIPLMLETMLDSGEQSLWPRIIFALPQIGKAAVNPLVAALPVSNTDVRLNLINALGEIGYPQAIPYLLKLMADNDVRDDVKTAASAAIERIESSTGRPFPGSAANHFYFLADKYYNENDAVRADPRISTSNVWYWDEPAQALTAVVVPEPIFGPVMAMRCCEEALRQQADHAGAIALWLAANVRREHRLGLDVESGDPSEQGELDPTRPNAFPRGLYFTQAAGPRYAHLMLERAVRDKDTQVALGAIEALRVTAGESSLIGTEDYKQPLVQALQFPDLLVRIRASLALGSSLPKTPFAGSQHVIPLLATALTLTGREQVLVVDTDESNLNRIAGVMRAGDRDVIAGASLYSALDRVRAEFPAITVIVLASDIAEPDIVTAIRELRAEFAFSKTPIVVLAKPHHDVLAEELALADRYVETVPAGADDAALEDAIRRVRERTNQAPLDADLALSLAMQAAEILRAVTVDGGTVLDFGLAEPALISALSATDEGLQIASASVLALAHTPTSQRAICHVALDGSNTDSLRVAAYASLAESAKSAGNLLEQDQIAELVRNSREDSDLVLRTAASEALGALNIATNQASEIIRSFYGG